MAAIRSFSRLLANRSMNTIVRRGYADEMSFTLAAGNQVTFLHLIIRLTACYINNYAS